MSSIFAETTEVEGVYVGINDNVAVVFITGTATVDDGKIRDIFEKGVTECRIYKCVSEPQKLTLSTAKRRMEEPASSAEKRRRVSEPVAVASDSAWGEEPTSLQPQAFQPDLSPTSPVYYPGGMQRSLIPALYGNIYTQPSHLHGFDLGSGPSHGERSLLACGSNQTIESFPSHEPPPLYDGLIPLIDLTEDDEDSTACSDSNAGTVRICSCHLHHM
ncbi:uncharacterized protein LOC119576263 [Penaeus monodon]|uniref:uncharacterized protein LOC119576263 n=1 Tax=Penaeus monodon TaxID=6687 RepID=UPI0018A71B4E|nr:uncharacterized protein LOC119576263 [Penaeus monodon]